MRLKAIIKMVVIVSVLAAGTARVESGVVHSILSPYESRFGYLGNPYGILGVQDTTQSWTTVFFSGLYFQPFDDLGFRWDRPHPGPFNRNLIEHARGVYDFSIPDAYVFEAQRRGIQIIATIWPYADWDQALWAGNPDCKRTSGWTSDLPQSRCKPFDMEAYKTFVRALVGRYAGIGFDTMPLLAYPIKHWEVINEPESSLSPSSPLIFFKGNPLDYLDLLKATAEAVWAADPDATVVNGGTVGNNIGYWRAVFQAGGARYFSLGSQHYFPSNTMDTDLGSSEWVNLLNEYGIRGSWNTEYLELSEDHPDLGISASGFGQAERLIKAYTRSFAAGTGRIFYVYYRMKDGGLIIPNPDRKSPAYFALKTLIEKVDGFIEVATTAPHDNTYVFAYKYTVNDSPVYVLWAAAAHAAVVLPLSDSNTTYVRITNAVPVDAFGTMPVKYVSVSNGTAVIDISPSPVYVEEIR